VSFESVQLIANGMLFEGWTAVSVTAAMPQGTRAFDVAVTEIGPFPATPWNFPPGTSVVVAATGTTMVTGYVDDYMPSGDASSHSVRITGRGRSCDLIDCSAVHETGRFENQSVLQIAQALDRFGVGIQAAGSALAQASQVVPWFQLRVGATAWEEIIRLVQSRGLTLKGEADGSASLFRAGTERHAGGLMQGENIIAMSGRISGRDTFSHTSTIGQSSVGVEDEDFEVEEVVVDESISRYRPRVVVAQGEITPQLAQSRSSWERARAHSWSKTAEIIVPGFRDKAGQLWEPGHLVFVYSPWLKVEQDMLIQRVTFRQNDGEGTVSSLELIEPEAGGGSTDVTGSAEEWLVPPDKVVKSIIPSRPFGGRM